MRWLEEWARDEIAQIVEDTETLTLVDKPNDSSVLRVRDEEGNVYRVSVKWDGGE